MSSLKILYSPEDIRKRLQELASEIHDVYDNRPFTAVVVLKGAIFFAADLMRLLSNPIDLHFVELETHEHPDLEQEISIRYWSRDFDIKDRDVLIIEDILDTGVTLEFLIRAFEQHGARSIRVCCLLEKPARRRVNIQADFVGFVVPEVFIVGYGLHHKGRFRNLPYLAELVQEGEKA